MNATAPIAAPRRGQIRGSTSQMRRGNSAHRRHRSDHLPCGLVPRTAQPAQELTVVKEVRPQHPPEGEDPRRMTGLGQHQLPQQRRERRGAPGRARRAEATALAGEHHEVLGAARPAARPCKAELEDAALEVGAPIAFSAAARQKP